MSLILTVRSAIPTHFIFYICMGIVLFFSDKIINSEKIKERTAVAFFVFAACYQTFYQLFCRSYENNKQPLVASALALFLVTVFAATDIKKLPLSILATIAVCFLDLRVAAPCCLFLLAYSIVKIQLKAYENPFTKKSGKNKKQKNKKSATNNKNKILDFEPFTVSIFSIIVSVIGLLISIISVIKNEYRLVESVDYAFAQFKNFLGFTILIIFLFVKLMRSEIKSKTGIIAGCILNLAPIPLYFSNYGWCLFSIFFISTILFLGMLCLETESIVNSIKDDLRNHRLLFFTELLLLLQ